MSFTVDGATYEVAAPSGMKMPGCLLQGNWWWNIPGMLPEGQAAELTGRVYHDTEPMDLPHLFWSRSASLRRWWSSRWRRHP